MACGDTGFLGIDTVFPGVNVDGGVAGVLTTRGSLVST